MDIIDSMANPMELEDTEVSNASNNDIQDADLREYESEYYFTNYTSKNKKGLLVLLNKVKTFPTKSHNVKTNAAFPELIQDLMSMNMKGLERNE